MVTWPCLRLAKYGQTLKIYITWDKKKLFLFKYLSWRVTDVRSQLPLSLSSNGLALWDIYVGLLSGSCILCYYTRNTWHTFLKYYINILNSKSVSHFWSSTSSCGQICLCYYSCFPSYHLHQNTYGSCFAESSVCITHRGWLTSHACVFQTDLTSICPPQIPSPLII